MRNCDRTTFRLSRSSKELLVAVSRYLTYVEHKRYTMTDVLELALKDFCEKVLPNGGKKLDSGYVPDI